MPRLIFANFPGSINVFSGSMVALVTPMHGDGSLDYTALERLIDFHVEAGTDALVIAGTTGESATLLKPEHAELIFKAVELADGRIPIIAGTGSNATAQTLDLSRAVQSSGAKALLVVTPYYNKPTQEGLYRHYSMVADAVSVPLILYNVPGRTGCDMLPETVARLAPHPNIVGIKEAVGETERCRELVQRCQGQLEIYSGDDPTVLDFIRCGAKGVISVTANVAPAQMHEMCVAALKGDFGRAEAIDQGLRDLHHLLFVESNPIPVKWAVHRMGMIEEGIRLPLTWLSQTGQQKLEPALLKLGVAK
jgi:4-hydroxy-tetrahydrodipicolinate synthase